MADKLRGGTTIGGNLAWHTGNMAEGVQREHIAADAIDGTKIANDVINSEHYAAGSIDNEHIADNAINSEHYADLSIDRGHLAADVIDGTKIANDVINSEHYVAGSIDEEHLNVTGTPTNDHYLRSNGANSFEWVVPPNTTTGTTAIYVVTQSDSSNSNRPFIWATSTTDNTSKTLYTDTATTCYINPSTNTIGASNLYASAQSAGDYFYSHTPGAGSWDHLSHGGLLMNASSSSSAYNVVRVNTDNGFKIQTLGGTGGTQRWYTNNANYITFAGTTITASLNGVASKAAVSNTTTATTYPVVFHNNASTLYDSGLLTYQASTGTLNASKFVGDGSSLTNLPLGFATIYKYS